MHYFHFNPQLVSLEHQEGLKTFFLCKNLSQSDRLLGFSKGRGITWFLNTKSELGVNSVLRHYYRGGLFGKVVKDHYLFRDEYHTRARQEFELLSQLHQWQLPVPRPIAVHIQRRFACYQADILLEKIEHTQDLSQYLQKNRLTDQQYRQIGALIARLHRHQVHHSDLNIHNILINPTEQQFWLIDFDKCRIEKGEDWKAANLARLLRSFEKEQKRLGIYFTPQNWAALIMGYQ